MAFTDDLLTPGVYFQQVVKKNTIYIHHTAGGNRPDWTISGWQSATDKEGHHVPVSTAYVIGGKSTTDGNIDFDGKVYRAFDDKYWAYHLGLNAANNVQLNSESVAIEICNYGPLTKTINGTYLNYVNKAVPESDVVDLGKPFRGFRYYHKYTDAQLVSLKALILDVAKVHSIDLSVGLKQLVPLGATAFELNQGALKGTGGLWTHTNVRQDKFDCSPQPQLLELIKSL